MSIERNIFNGARCSNYSWTQTHSDLEIHIPVGSLENLDMIDIALTLDKIKISTRDSVLLDGRLERDVIKSSITWQQEVTFDQKFLIVYMDKMQNLWWKTLLIGEKQLQIGPVERISSMYGMDESSRSRIDKLITDHKIRLTKPNPAHHIG